MLLSPSFVAGSGCEARKLQMAKHQILSSLRGTWVSRHKALEAFEIVNIVLQCLSGVAGLTA